MIVTEIYDCQGLATQLHCYVTTRTIALDKGYNFAIMNPQKFKCLDFMDLDIGIPVFGGSGPELGPPNVLPVGIKKYFREKEIKHSNGSDIRLDDTSLQLVEDKTKLDGLFQSENTIIHRKEEIKTWLTLNEDFECYDYSGDEYCVINFKGGEYANDSNVFLDKSYWNNSINKMLTINPDFKFIVITDDVVLARMYFPSFEVHNFSISKDFSIIKNAHYLILSNSNFSYFATFISEENKYIIAPKYWKGYNSSDGYWNCGYSIYRNYNYMDKQGKLFTYEECVSEFEDFKITNKQLWG